MRIVYRESASVWYTLQSSAERPRVHLWTSEVHSGARPASNVTEAALEEHLLTAGMPDPDLLIRTSGHYSSAVNIWLLTGVFGILISRKGVLGIFRVV